MLEPTRPAPQTMILMLKAYVLFKSGAVLGPTIAAGHAKRLEFSM